MKIRSGRTLSAAAGMGALLFVGLLFPADRAAAQEKPLLAEQVFKNIQVLRGIPVDDFMGAMGVMVAALEADCADCHEGAGTDRVNWAADTPKKIMARAMVTMMG